MKSTKSAGRYAKALLELALDQDKLAPIEADMLQLIKLADEANDFQIFINSPLIQIEKKIAVIKEIFKDFNDSIKDAHELANYCKNLPVKINIIEYNPIDDGEYQQANPERVEAFAKFLESKNLVVNIRRSRGKDIDAACGQLANKNAALLKDDVLRKLKHL